MTEVDSHHQDRLLVGRRNSHIEQADALLLDRKKGSKEHLVKVLTEASSEKRAVIGFYLLRRSSMEEEVEEFFQRVESEGGMQSGI